MVSCHHLHRCHRSIKLALFTFLLFKMNEAHLKKEKKKTNNTQKKRKSQKLHSRENLLPDRSYSGRISAWSHTSTCPLRLLSSVELVRVTILYDFFSFLVCFISLLFSFIIITTMLH